MTSTITAAVAIAGNGFPAPTAPSSSSALHAVETAFTALSAGDAPLTLPAVLLGDAVPVDTSEVTVAEVRAILTATGAQVPGTVRDAVWAELVRRARLHPGVWTLAAAGMAVPALRKLAAGFARSYDGPIEDLDADILTGFLEQLAVVDTGKQGIFPDLWWAARRTGSRTSAAQIDFTRHAAGYASVPPPAPCGHEDLVLARAQRHGVITAEDAELIGMTRLDGMSLAEAAEALGASKNAVKIRRQRAEARLVAWIEGRRVPSQTALAQSRTRT